MQLTTKKQIINDIFLQFDKEKITYVVLRNTHLIYSANDDVDLALEKHMLTKAEKTIRSVCRKHGAKIILHEKKPHLHTVVLFHSGSQTGIALDLHMQLGNPCTYLSLTKVLDTRVEQGTYYVPQKGIKELLLLLHSSFDKPSIPKKYYDYLHHASHQSAFITQLSTHSKKLAPRIIKSLKEKQFEDAYRTTRRINFDTCRLSQLFLHHIYLLRVYTRRNGYVISFVGPDGAGKSTLLLHLKHFFEELTYPTYYLYVGGKEPVLPSSKFISKRISGTQKAKRLRGGTHKTFFQKIIQEMNFFHYLIELLSQYVTRVFLLRRKKVFLVTDRYLYDYVTFPSSLAKIGWLQKIIDSIIPSPDMLFILDAPATQIVSRKKDNTKEETHRQALQYNRYASMKNAYVVNTSKTIDESTTFVKNTLLEFLESEHEK